MPDPIKRLFNAAKQKRTLTLTKGEVQFLAYAISNAAQRIQGFEALQAMTPKNRRKAMRAVKKQGRQMLRAAKKNRRLRAKEEKANPLVTDIPEPQSGEHHYT